ncbi:MAG: hypothetical protein KC478_10360 [Bacteriovoracaceae bacterium]|nr:hypothetical protein [Bacteriovoracaceae bacterium]
MQNLWIIIWPIQALLMFLDEFYFHRRRGLGRWERIGHPIDTAVFLSCFIYPLLFEHNDKAAISYMALALISTLIITKDEWVHHKECNLIEQWLHTFLFIIHPIAIFATYLCWSSSNLFPVYLQACLIFSFLIYQIYFWNFRRNHNEVPSN